MATKRFNAITAAAAFALACNGGFDTQGREDAGASGMTGDGGTGTGQGGQVSVGGAGMGGGASGLDAGPDGAATPSQGGSSQLPPGCPSPAPIAVEGQVIAIQSINFVTSEIVLRNPTQTDQTIQVGRQGWQWCAYPRYWSLADEVKDVVLGPGETYSFVAVYNTSGPLVLYPEEGEMAMYPKTGVFEEYETMQAFVAWGEVQAFRESYAVQKELWTFGDRIQIRAGHAGFIATGRTDRAEGYTSVRADCLVAPPNQ